MRILFDGYWWVEGPISNRGVQREFIRAWADRFPEDDISLAVPREHLATAARDAPASAELCGARLRPHGLACALEYPRLARRFAADITITHNFAPVRGRSAVFLHDVLFQSNPEWFTAAERLYFRGMPLLAPRAEVVFSSSATEAARIRSYNRRVRRVVPVGLSVANDLVDAEAERPPAPADDLESGRYLLCVARLNVRKNLAAAIDAAIASERLTPHCPLVIVGEEEGRVGALSSAVTAAVADGRVRMLARVTGGQLKWLYQNARVFLFPSLDEGFGLPPVEALYFGCPVIASDIPVLRETLRDDARFVDPRDVASFAGCIAEAVDGAAERVRLPPERFSTWRHSVELMRAALVPTRSVQKGPA